MQRSIVLIVRCLVPCLALLITGCGDSASNTNIVPPAGKDFVYTANSAGSPTTVSALTTDRSAGTLSSIAGSPFSAGSGSFALAADPANKFLYVANYFSGDISAFTINSTSGVLTAVSGSPYSGELGVDSLAIDSTGKFLYAVSQRSPDVWAYSISSSGALATVSGFPISMSGSVVSNQVIMDPASQYAYVTASDSSSSYLYGFIRDANSGALTLLAGFPVSLDGMAGHAAFAPNGNFLLVTGTGIFGTNGGVTAFRFNASTGALAKVSSTVQTGMDPSGVAFDASGKFVYIPNTSDATISSFTLDTAGGLTPIAGSPIPSGGNGAINGPMGIATDSFGHFVYVCNASNDISVFSINTTTGVLTPVAGSPFAAGGNGPHAIIFVRSSQ